MKCSYSWLEDYLKLTQSPEEIGDILTEIGLEVEGLDTVESLPGGLKGLVIGQVKQVDPHPDADRLQLTKVDVGGDDLLSIVCGAPNVAPDQKVVVATVGTILHPSTGDPFTIKKSKIRGQVSEGMLCAEDEIGLGESHDGIMVLDSSAQVGMPASEFFQIKSDFVYEIGLTPNRADAVCHRGVARDLHAALSQNYGYTIPLQFPTTDPVKSPSSPSTSFELEVKNTVACPRYAGVVLRNIKIEKSPEWLATKLQSIGVKSINNVVDITNYILHDMGQPLHAFDLDEIKKNKIIVQTLPSGTKFEGLDGRVFHLDKTDLMICDGDSTPLCIAGVFGGKTSGVTVKTTSLFLESAHFDQEWVRRTSVRHNLRTDAAKVYEKGSDPSLPAEALHRAVELLVEYAGAQVDSDYLDVYPEPIMPKEIKVSTPQVTSLIGMPIADQEMESICNLLDFDYKALDDDHFQVKIPTNKPDVTREADVIEEILRIYGFNKIPLSPDLHFAFNQDDYTNPYELQDEVTRMLVASGFNETMSLSLVEEKMVPPSIDESKLIKINNTSNVTLNIMRPHMMCSMLTTLIYNQNRRQKNFLLFEFGKTYRKERNITERQELCIVLSGLVQPKTWDQTEEKASFYRLKSIVINLLRAIGLDPQEEMKAGDSLMDYGETFTVNGKPVATVGKLSSDAFTDNEYKQDVFYATLQWDDLLALSSSSSATYEEISKYPTVERDLALIVPEGVSFKDIKDSIKKQSGSLLKDLQLFDIYKNEEQLGQGFSSYAIHLEFSDSNKTLTDKQVDKIINKILSSLQSTYQIQIR